MKERKKLGEILIEGGLISLRQLNAALANQKKHGGRLGTNLIELGYITEKDLMNFLSRYFRLPNIDFAKATIDKNILKLVPPEVARRYNVLPIKTAILDGKKTMLLAMSDPTNNVATEEVERVSGYKVQPAVAADATIAEAIDKHHGPAEDEIRVFTADPFPKEEDAEPGPVSVGENPTVAAPSRESEMESARALLAVRALLEILEEKGLVSKEEFFTKLKGF